MPVSVRVQIAGRVQIDLYVQMAIHVQMRNASYSDMWCLCLYLHRWALLDHSKVATVRNRYSPFSKQPLLSVQYATVTLLMPSWLASLVYMYRPVMLQGQKQHPRSVCEGLLPMSTFSYRTSQICLWMTLAYTYRVWLLMKFSRNSAHEFLFVKEFCLIVPPRGMHTT